jgi:hypothetical protein
MSGGNEPMSTQESDGAAPERAAFEAFAQNCPMGRYSIDRDKRPGKSDGYWSSHTQLMWDAWNARAALADRAAVQAGSVAEVMPGWVLAWAGREPIATLLARHPSVRIGSKLYAHPAPTQPVAWVDERAISWLADHHRRLDASITTRLEARKSFERPMPLYASPPAAAVPAPSEAMEPFLLADLERELGVNSSILSVAIYSQGLGNYSVNMALPASVAEAMRRHFATSPPPAAPAPPAQPLTEDQVFASQEFMHLNGSLLQLAMPQLMLLVRAIERAHGIGSVE